MPPAGWHIRRCAVAMSKPTRRLLEAGDRIYSEPPDRADFLHTVMCQVGMPRRRTAEAQSFRASQRTYQHPLGSRQAVSTASSFVEQPLPYGTTPRLVMVHVSSEAIRTQSRSIEVGDSMRQFLNTLGVQTNGGERGGYTMFKRQMKALAAAD